MSSNRASFLRHLTWQWTVVLAAYVLARGYTSGQAEATLAGPRTVQAQVEATKEMNREVLQRLNRGHQAETDN